MDYSKLPIYLQKDKILKALEDNQIIIVESPTGSGKTTQIPLILYDNGYTKETKRNNGVIGITQPRRIASVSIAEYIEKQLFLKAVVEDKDYKDFIGVAAYKIRFNDRTTEKTKIKIMTDGTLLQEIKNNYLLSDYSVIMIDEAHERSLNIDFILGLLKKIIKIRDDLKIIISSATLDTKVFSDYFGGAPIIKIEGSTYPIEVIYQPLESKALLNFKIKQILDQIFDSEIQESIKEKTNLSDLIEQRAILIFLEGERSIKQIQDYLKEEFQNKLTIRPLYGRLSKEEQDKVFLPPNAHHKKVVIATNIAETSITIDDIVYVIDSGFVKISNYDPKTFISSLQETTISKAYADQRKGRAGRTQEGVCFRLYSEQEYNKKQLYTQEEIYRTDLSEVVLQIADIGISNFYEFNFISPPQKQELDATINLLKDLNALDDNNFLTDIGKMMIQFPLSPRYSRIIIEAITKHNDVIEEILIIISFLTNPSPHLFPHEKEKEAKEAHKLFNDQNGDFLSYINIHNEFTNSKNKTEFCNKNYFDISVLEEILNVKAQLEDIIYNMGIPCNSNISNYKGIMICIGKGLSEFICKKDNKKDFYRNLFSNNMMIHPGSVLVKKQPKYIIASEIIKTSRTFLKSCSVINEDIITAISKRILKKLKKEKISQELPKENNDKNKGLTYDKDTILIGSQTFVLSGEKNKKKDNTKILYLNIDDFLYIAKNMSLKKSKRLTQIRNLKIVVRHRDIEYLIGNDFYFIISYGRFLNKTNRDRVNVADKIRDFKINDLKDHKLFANIKKDLMHLGFISKNKNKGGILSLNYDSKDNFKFRMVKDIYSFSIDSYNSLEYLFQNNNELKNDNRILELYEFLGDLYNK